MQGQGNAYDLGARIYDSRLWRWMSLDPLMKVIPEFGPYNGFEDNPVVFVDPTGLIVSFAGLTQEEASHRKSTIEILKKSDLFREMYEALESSTTVVSFALYQQDIKSKDKRISAGGWKEVGGTVIHWGNPPGSKTQPQLNDKFILLQGMFHMYQGIDETKKLYEGTLITDLEAEGELFTYYVSEQITPGELGYWPKQDVKFAVTEDGIEKTVEPIFQFDPSLAGNQTSSPEFDKAYQAYKAVFVKGEKANMEIDMSISSSYHGPVTETPAVGIISRTTQIGPRLEDGTF